MSAACWDGRRGTDLGPACKSRGPGSLFSCHRTSCSVDRHDTYICRLQNDDDCRAAVTSHKSAVVTSHKAAAVTNQQLVISTELSEAEVAASSAVLQGLHRI